MTSTPIPPHHHGWIGPPSSPQLWPPDNSCWSACPGAPPLVPLLVPPSLPPSANMGVMGVAAIGLLSVCHHREHKREIWLGVVACSMTRVCCVVLQVPLVLPPSAILSPTGCFVLPPCCLVCGVVTGKLYHSHVGSNVTHGVIECPECCTDKSSSRRCSDSPAAGTATLG